MNRYPLRLSALAIGVAMIVGTYSLVRPPAPQVAAHPAPTGQPTRLTIDAVYHQVQQAISRPGLLYEATIRETYQQDGTHTTTTVQWVDAGHNVAREEPKSVPNGPPVSQTTLLTPQGYYQRGPDGHVMAGSSRWLTCPGTTLSVSVVLGLAMWGPGGCPGTRLGMRWGVQRGHYGGRPALVLMETHTVGTIHTRTEGHGTMRLYLDARTFLPLARQWSVRLTSGQVLPNWDRGVYAHRFVPAQAVPARFFDPAALGYVPPNLEVPLNGSPPGFTVYWLGVHFAGAASFPPLLLGKVEGPAEGAYSRFTLSYMPPDDPFGSAVVTLEEWPRANWVANSGYETSQELSGPCWHREDLALPHGRARIFLGFAYAGRTKPCPRRPYTLYIAHVFLGQTVIHVAVQGDTAPGAVTSPYVTRAGLVALVRALQPRVPSGPVPTPTPTFGPPPIPTGQPAGLSVAQVYQRVQQAISRPGLLYHATIHITGAYTSTITQWVDARRNVAREEQVAISATGKPLTQTRQTTITTAQGRYLRYGPDGEVIWTSPGATTCPGATRAASAVLSSFGCPTYTGQSTTVVQQGQYGGHPAIVLISSGTFCGEDECSASISRLYLDAHTFLPIAQETTGQMNGDGLRPGQIQPLRARGVYAHTFVPAHAVPAHFFDPAAIGYVPPENQLNHVPRGFTVYWLGTHVAGVRGLPPLLLTKVDPAGATGPGYLFILTYSRTDDRFGAPGVTLQEWPLGVVGNSPWPYGPCWAHRDITTPRGRARIFLGFENAPPPGSKSCPAPPYNRFMARVYLGQTMVTVDAPGLQAGSLRITNPYNTRRGIEMVVRALQPRVPTHGTTGSNK